MLCPRNWEIPATMTDDTEDGRLLLGLRGWPHPEWEGDYFPEDLPAEWQFAYYANEAGCLLLPAEDWLALSPDELTEWLEDCPSWFRFYLEWPNAESSPAAGERLEIFGGQVGAILDAGDRPVAAQGVPIWRIQDQRVWVDSQGRKRLVCLRTAGRGLRQLRGELDGLPASVQALVIDDPNPARLGELRTLCELLGIA